MIAIRQNVTVDLQIEGEQTEQVEEFKFLGSLKKTASSERTQKMKKRISPARENLQKNSDVGHHLEVATHQQSSESVADKSLVLVDFLSRNAKLDVKQKRQEQNQQRGNVTWIAYSQLEAAPN